MYKPRNVNVIYVAPTHLSCHCSFPERMAFEVGLHTGKVAPKQWMSSTVLNLCNNFFANTFTDRHLYRIMYQLTLSMSLTAFQHKCKQSKFSFFN